MLATTHTGLMILKWSTTVQLTWEAKVEYQIGTATELDLQLIHGDMVLTCITTTTHLPFLALATSTVCHLTDTQKRLDSELVPGILQNQLQFQLGHFSCGAMTIHSLADSAQESVRYLTRELITIQPSVQPQPQTTRRVLPAVLPT